MRWSSLRTNAVLMALAMLVLPLLIVAGWSFLERDIGGRLQVDAKGSVEEAALLIARDPARDQEVLLQEIAARWGTRIRLVRDASDTERGAVVVDADADRGTDLVHQVGMLFFGPDGAPTMRELDETLGPVWQRDEAWSKTPTGCRTSEGGKLLVCHSVMRVTIDGHPHILYAQESSRRAVRALYDLRYHVTRLSIVMLPLALLFSWWMGKRMVRPIEWLRARVLEKARRPDTRADIDLRGGDEVRDLAEAFNDLLHALDERRRANEAFVADLVHEFKNPVAAIRTAAESLGSGSADAQRAARLAKILEDSSARLDALVSQFLELARAEAGMPKEDRTTVDLAALASGIVGTSRESFDAVTFEADVPSSPVHVTGVPPRLDSLVRNLVDNAASFAGDGGTVNVVVRKEEGGIASIEVTDSGPGIAEEDLPRVFDRFFTTRALTPHTRGTGLGLALVKAVAEAHGGEVSARSVVGEGATFRVVLPTR